MYEVAVDEPVRDQLDALPQDALEAWRELHTTLELAPHNGRPLFAATPDGVRTFVFGEHGQGLAYYLIIEHAREVAVLDVQWFA